MRTSWWGCLFAGVLVVCWAVYQHVNQPSSPAGSPEASEQSEQRPLEQTPEQPVADKDEGRVQQQADAAPAGVQPDQLPKAQKEVRPHDAVDAGVVADKDASRVQEAEAAPAGVQPDHLPKAQKEPRLQDAVGAGVVADRDERPSRDVDTAPAGLQPDQSAKAQKEARLEDPASPGTIEHSEPSDTKGKLSYLAWYAYSEIPPETKPADTVLNFFKDVPSGTPVEEIKRVADVLGMDFTFMKAIAKIESGFDPKQRTGSYIGLFQLSKYEFRKYGSGDILGARENAVAAALKMRTEAVLFQMFTRRKATLFDLYLIHQQGIEGAAEHISQPNRLAWRSMCKTGEGKEKGEKWCKRAIWGNTLPAIKRVWKTVNNVTSDAFVAMWQQRVSHFYTRYSEAAAN